MAAQATHQESRSFDGHVEEISRARRWVRAVLEARGITPDDALVVVSELATNAVLHARSTFVVSVTVADDDVVVDVGDDSSRLPEQSPAAPGALSGRGLQMVAALAADWGIRPGADDGKVVWARLALGR